MLVDSESYFGPVPSDELELKKGNLLATLRSVFQQFYVSFDFFITRQAAELRSVVHLTVGDNSGQDGSRIPGIWIDKDNKLRVISSVNGDGDYRYVHDIAMKMGQWYKLEVEQMLIEEKVEIYRIR